MLNLAEIALIWFNRVIERGEEVVWHKNIQGGGSCVGVRGCAEACKGVRNCLPSRLVPGLFGSCFGLFGNFPDGEMRGRN